MKAITVLAVGGLVLGAAACGKKPSSNSSSGAGTYKACMVTDTGGIDDKSFNSSAWKGLNEAYAADKSKMAKPVYRASTSDQDYTPNLDAFATQKCNIIIGVGGLMGDAVKAAAQKYPKQQFGIIDSNSSAANVFPMQFDTVQAGYLAGYLAAGMSKTGKVATYGGLKIGPVTIFMDGFVQGVAKYNTDKSKNVGVLGWDVTKQDGTFVPGANPFGDTGAGTRLANQFVAQGADVIMPVAGGTGQGTASVAQASGGKLAVIWVDQDGCVSAAQYCSVFLSTVVKGIDGAVKATVTNAANGQKLDPAQGFVGTLKNNGVSLAPYHDYDSKVPADLKSAVDKLKQDIISGAVTVTSPSSPK